MFERYTEKARRVIFFARYEASNFGSPYIETEHLLLGILREDKALTSRVLRSGSSVESIRQQIEGLSTVREKISTSVDLPLSNECKRVMAYAAEEAERLAHKHIGCEHLFLGLLREQKSLAARLLAERGVRIEEVRVSVAQEALTAVGGTLGKGRPSSIPVKCVSDDGSVIELTLASVGRVPRIGEWVTFAENRTFVVMNVEWVYSLGAAGSGGSDQTAEEPGLTEIKLTLKPLKPATEEP
jgi:hypothetical protein